MRSIVVRPIWIEPMSNFHDMRVSLGESCRREHQRLQLRRGGIGRQQTGFNSLHNALDAGGRIIH
ncbi:hypothetical protein ACVIGA_000910 [Bradyrhizobium sp. USDA 3240]